MGNPYRSIGGLAARVEYRSNMERADAEMKLEELLANQKYWDEVNRPNLLTKEELEYIRRFWVNFKRQDKEARQLYSRFSGNVWNDEMSDMKIRHREEWLSWGKDNPAPSKTVEFVLRKTSSVCLS